MKEGKAQMGKSKAAKPTRDQKAVIMAAGLNWSDWLVLSETDEELHIVSRGTGESRTLKTPLGDWRLINGTSRNTRIL